MSQTILITINGPGGAKDLTAPSDTAIADLMPGLLELFDAENGEVSDWELGLPGRAALPAAETLGDHKIDDGAMLELRSRKTEADEVGEEPVATGPLLDDSGGTPLERTRQVLPDKPGMGSRVGAWFDATVKRGGERDDPGRDEKDPRALTSVRPSVLDRGRNSWRSTRYLNMLDEAIKTPRLRRCATIAVISPKGGVGKTTVTALLGSLLALVRRDRAIAVDTNPDYGSLGRALAPDHDVFVDDFLDLLEDPDLTPPQLDSHLARAGDGLMVLPAPTDPARMQRLDREAYSKVIHRLQEMTGMLLLDCGTGLQEPPAQAAIMAADQLVLVSDAEPATASLIAEAYELLEQANVPLVLLINKQPRAGSRLDIEAFQRQLPKARGVIVLHNDPKLAATVNAGKFTWSDPAGTWNRSMRELAAVLISDWDELGLAA